MALDDAVLPRDAETGAVIVRRDDPAVGYLMLDTEAGTCLAVFTDEDLAARFIDSTRQLAGTSAIAVAIETPDQFLRLAGMLPPICTAVAFDPPGVVGGRARWVVALTDVVVAVRSVQSESEGE